VSVTSPADFEKQELLTAMTELSSLNPEQGKAAMMNQVDDAAQRVLKVLRTGDPTRLQEGAYLSQIRFVLDVMEQCKAFRDPQFTRMVRTHFEDIMGGLESLPSRVKSFEAQKKQAAAGGAKTPPPSPSKGSDEAEETPKEKKIEFQYTLAEKICIRSVVQHFDAKLDVLRSTHLYGRHSINDIGIAPLFFYSIDFSIVIEDAIDALMKDNRELMTRRVYNDTDPEADEEKIRAVLREKKRAIIDVVESGFSGWGSSQTEAEKRARRGPKAAAAGKKEKKKGGLFSKLLGKEEKVAPAPKKKGPKPKEAWENVMDLFKEAEVRGELFFPKTFNFSMLTYLSRMQEKAFKAEGERVIQIAEQAQSGPGAKQAVARALEQAFKNSDQTFFELLILNLLYTKNKIGLDEVQNACMGQKLDEARLPLSIPEMGRRPNTYAEQIIKLLKNKADPRTLQNCLEYFFEAILVLHLIKFENDFKNATIYIEHNKESLPKPLQSVVDGILSLSDRVMFARQQARETGEDTARKTKDSIDHTIEKIMTAYKKMYEKMTT